MSKFDFEHEIDIAWCPGCGNFPLRKSIIMALNELNLDPTQVVFSSGIGQAAKMPQYIDANYFNGLHGRGLSVAQAVQSVNPTLTVIAEGGDGDMYGEGGNHFIHNIRRNPNLAHIVHNNMIYGLLKGKGHPPLLEDSKRLYKSPESITNL
jgi:2-oxoglutarate/2-oxoacid ferredoxin oxidoreductase subunit beta